MNIKFKSSVRVAITLIAFFTFQLTIPFLDYFAQDLIITKTLVFSFLALLILFLNYNLLTLHFNRLKNQKDRLLFFVLGFSYFFIILGINHYLIKADFSIPHQVSTGFNLFYPLFIIVFSLPFSCTYIIAYKVMSDNFNIHNSELKVILISSIMFATLIALVSGNWNVLLFLNFVTNLLVTLGVSYLYNQTGNLAGGMLSLGAALLVYHGLWAFVL